MNSLILALAFTATTITLWVGLLLHLRRLGRERERTAYQAHVAAILRGQLANERLRIQSLLEANCELALANQRLQGELRAVQRVAYSYFLYLN